jgi:hypothetical protein
MSLVETEEKDQGIGSIKMIIDTCLNPWLTKHLFGNIENAVQNENEFFSCKSKRHDLTFYTYACIQIVYKFMPAYTRKQEGERIQDGTNSHPVRAD